jgi:uncharacterized protein with GYD domain
MPKFLYRVSYTHDGVKGLLKEGGTGRRAAVNQLTKSLGGKLESFYYALGQDDLYLVADFPDATTAAAVSLTVTASGAVNVATIPLLSVEEVDAACKKTPQYRAPGK